MICDSLLLSENEGFFLSSKIRQSCGYGTTNQTRVNFFIANIHRHFEMELLFFFIFSSTIKNNRETISAKKRAR